MRLNVRRLIVSLAALIAALGAMHPLRGQTIVAGPTTAELTGAAGDRITVPIAIDMTGAPGINLGAYRITFSWNPTGLSFVNATGGTFGSPVFNSEAAESSGVLQFAAASATGANGIFTLANVTLDVNATISGAFTVVFDELTDPLNLAAPVPLSTPLTVQVEFISSVSGAFTSSVSPLPTVRTENVFEPDN